MKVSDSITPGEEVGDFEDFPSVTSTPGYQAKTFRRTCYGFMRIWLWSRGPLYTDGLYSTVAPSAPAEHQTTTAPRQGSEIVRRQCQEQHCQHLSTYPPGPKVTHSRRSGLRPSTALDLEAEF